MKVRIATPYVAADSYIRQIPSFYEQEGELIFRKRNVVKRFHTPYGDWIVKRYKRPLFIQRLAYTFWRKSKALRAFLYAKRLRDLGINTPTEVAYIEIDDGLLFSDSYFVSLPCPWPSLFDEMVGKSDSFDSMLADQLATYLITLHQKGVLHGDLNLDNILCNKKSDDCIEFALIDTNRTRFVSHPTQTDCLNNLVRITHRRKLLYYIVSRYAQMRGWIEKQCVDYVFLKLDLFEHRKKMKGKLKNISKR